MPPGSPKRAGRPRRDDEELEKKREELIACARDLYLREGYEAVSIRRITGETGMSPMSFYQFFPHKRALLRHIWEDIFDEVFGRAERAAAKQNSPLEKLQAYMESIVHYWLKHSDHYRIVYLEDEMADGEDQLYAESSHLLQRLAKPGEWCGEAIALGLIRQEDPVLVLQMLIIQVHGLSQSLVTIPEMGWLSSRLLIRKSIENTLRGLRV